MKEYLTFTRTDRIGLLALVGLILIILFLPAVFPKTPPKSGVLFDSGYLSSAVPGEETKNAPSAFSLEEVPEAAKTPKASHAVLFQFDPNTLDAAGWQKLGLNDRVIHTLLNYRGKGGHFYKKEDLKKVWGLPADFYDKVEPFIVLQYDRPKRPENSLSKYERKIAVIDINTADTTALIALPGIGSKLANRIVNFRQKLGGFYTIDQIAETYGLKDSTFILIKPYLRAQEDGVKKFNINSATKDDLKPHPYIRWKIASAIVDYRIHHGVYTSIEDLKNLPEIDGATFEKLKHYLSI